MSDPIVDLAGEISPKLVPAVSLRQGTVQSVSAGLATVRLGGSSVDIAGVRWIGNAYRPKATDTVWLLQLGALLLILGRLGTSGDQLYIQSDGKVFSATDILVGTLGTLLGPESIELFGTTPFIDFHHASSAADYTARLITEASNILRLRGSTLHLDLDLLVDAYLRGNNGTTDQAPGIRTRTNSNYFSAHWTGSALELWVDGTNVKNFIIEHPSDPERYLVHTTLEGPENAVFYRGQANLLQGHCDVELPAYFADLVDERSASVQVTPIADGGPIPRLAASPVAGGKFWIESDQPRPHSCWWEVKAVRKDVPPLKVEPRRDEIEVHGFGPYTFYTEKEESHAAEL